MMPRRTLDSTLKLAHSLPLPGRSTVLYPCLYCIKRDDADYILSTFPIVRRQDEAA